MNVKEDVEGNAVIFASSSLLDTIRHMIRQTDVSQFNHQDNALVNFISSLPIGMWVHAVADSDSMEPKIPIGSTVKIIRMPFSAIRKNSIIAYAIRKRKRIIVHRAIEKTLVNGIYSWITKGDNAPSPDTYTVCEQDFIGIVHPLH